MPDSGPAVIVRMRLRPDSIRRYEVEKKSGPGQAESFYSQLKTDFPGSKASQQARDRLAALEQFRKQQQVVESYQAVYKRWPQSLKDSVIVDLAFFLDS